MSVWESLLSGPVLGLYLWTWLMIGTVLVMIAGLWITRNDYAPEGTAS